MCSKWTTASSQDGTRWQFPTVRDPKIIGSLNSRILIIRTPKVRYP